MDIDRFLSLIRDEHKILNERELRMVCEKAKEYFIEESNIQPVNLPVNICGDLHGQFFDVLELFRVGGQLPDTNYIFIGDFVDRGNNSVETFELLLCLKIKYPNHITLLRGNHECRQNTIVYGFYDEIVRKYGSANPWQYFMDVFDYLPIGAVVDEEILCVHGGLSPDTKTIDQMRLIDRRQEIPTEGPFCDLMWSDPYDGENWSFNSRGAGWLFGSKVVEEFNHLNGLQLIARAHQ